ncbi:MAG: hypothetical protein AB1847_14175 [bacterium]
MKRFNKIVIITCFFVFSLFFLSLSAQCQWSPTININLNFYGFPGSFPSSDSYWQPNSSQQIPQYGGLVTGTPYVPPGTPYMYTGGYYSPSTSAIYTPVSMPASTPVSTSGYTPVSTSGYTPVYAPAPSQYITYTPPSSDAMRLAAARISLIRATSDNSGYLYLLISEVNGENRSGLAILEPSGSDTYRYLSHIVLSEGYWYNQGESSLPRKIVIKDNLAIIGGEDLGMIYFVDITHKDNPQLINKVILADNEDHGVDRVLDIAVENEVLFVCIEDLDGLTDDHQYMVHALDISDPEKVTKENGVLGSYTVDKDYKVYGMISASGYLYLSGKKCVQDDYGLSIHIINSSDPKNLALVKVIDDLGAPPASEPEINVGVIEGDHLFTIVGAGEDLGPLVDGEFQLKIFDVSDPALPQLVSTSKKLTGGQILGSNGMVIRDNYAYVPATTFSPRRTKVYVFDVSDLMNLDLVDLTENAYGFGLNLYFADDDKLFLVTDETIKIFDIKNPENLPVAKTVDVIKILEDGLKDWGSAYPGYAGIPGGLYGGSSFIGGLYPSLYGGTYPTGMPYGMSYAAYGTGTVAGQSVYGTTGVPYSNPAYSVVLPSSSSAAGSLPGDPEYMSGGASAQVPFYGTGQYQYPPENPAPGAASPDVPGSPGSDSHAMNLDVNGDGMVTPADALFIFQKYLEIP